VKIKQINQINQSKDIGAYSTASMSSSSVEIVITFDETQDLFHLFDETKTYFTVSFSLSSVDHVNYFFLLKRKTHHTTIYIQCMLCIIFLKISYNIISTFVKFVAAKSVLHAERVVILLHRAQYTPQFLLQRACHTSEELQFCYLERITRTIFCYNAVSHSRKVVILLHRGCKEHIICRKSCNFAT